MDTLNFFQHYWWFIISLLGALLVFLLFVQGGQALLYVLGKNDEERNMIVNALGRKWEFTFTTLVTFGGAFFASFPLFYSTSFGGAFYVWMAILFAFVLQAVAYEYRRKPGNIFGVKTFNAFLMINGVLGPVLLGTAVGTFFTGSEFTIDRLNLANLGTDGASVISQWASPWHGLEAVLKPQNVNLGISVALLSQLLGCQYLINTIKDNVVVERTRSMGSVYGLIFVVWFVAWLFGLLISDGWAVDSTGMISIESYKYLNNFLEMPYLSGLLLIGVVSVLWSIYLTWRAQRSAIWFGGSGAVLTVLALLLCAGWNGTAYYPSTTEMQSSLTIFNSSSSLFTLRVMSIVSLMIPFVVAYIWYAWRSLNRTPITREEIRKDDHLY